MTVTIHPTGFIIYNGENEKPVDIVIYNESAFDLCDSICTELEKKGKHVAELFFDDYDVNAVDWPEKWRSNYDHHETYEPMHRGVPFLECPAMDNGYGECGGRQVGDWCEVHHPNNRIGS